MTSQAIKEENLSKPNSPAPAVALFLSLLLVTACITIQQLFFGSHWETNDDVAHILVTAGCAIVPHPDEHILTPNATVGIALKSLYAANPDLPWYFLMLLGVNALSLTAVGYAFLRKHDWKLALPLLLLFFAADGLFILTSLQFTSTALFAGLAAGLLLLLLSEPGCVLSKKETISVFLGSALLFVLSTLTRSSCAYLAELLTAAALLVRSFSLSYLRRRINPSAKWQSKEPEQPANAAPAAINTTTTFAALAVFLFCSFAMQYASQRYTDSDVQWKEFNSTRPALLKLIDFAGLSAGSKDEVLKKTGWSENDLDTLKCFLYADKQTFSSQKILQAAGGTPTIRQDLSWSYLTEQLSTIGKDNLLYPGLLLFAIACVFLPPNGMSFARLLTIALGVVAGALYMLCCLKLPARIYFPLSSFIVMLALFYISDPLIQETWRKAFAVRWKAAALVSLLVLTVAGIGIIENRWLLRPARKSTQKSALFLREVSELPRDKTYIAFAYGFPFELLPPSANIKRTLGDLKLLSVAGYNNSPIFEEQLNAVGLNHVFINSTRSDVVLVSDDWLNGFYTKYMKEHYKQTVVPTPVNTTATTMKLYKAQQYAWQEFFGRRTKAL